ncbi:hypothetical protein D3C76_1023490 [compost metagenome]
MGVFFGFGDAQLGLAVFRQVVAQHVFQAAGGEGRRCRNAGGVLGQHDETGQFWLAGTLEFTEVVFDEHAGQFAGAVGAEVHEHHGVAVFDLHRLTDGGGFDELVALATRVRGLQAFLGGGGVEFAMAVDDQVVGLGHTVPTVVAIHGEITADEAGDAAFAQGLEGGVQQFDRRLRAFRRGIAAVEEGVQVDFFSAALGGQFGHGDQVILVAVHAAIGQQAHEVHGFTGGDGFVHGGADGRVLEELAVADRFGHAGEVLVHHAAGAEIHVADLGVAHLAVRQANVHAAAGNQAVGHGGPQTIQYRLLRRKDGVGFRALTVTEAVENNQDQRFRRGSHGVRSWLN